MKKNIRKKILKIRKELPSEKVTFYSKEILNSIKKHQLITNNMTILVYMDFRNEVQTSRIIDYIRSKGASVILPRVVKDELKLYKVDSNNDLELSRYGILEPRQSNTPSQIADLNLILAPGVAFDRNGYRLGYGGGFYDKLLSQKKVSTRVIGLAFSCQIIDQVPREDHDFKMDGIITEKEYIQLV